MGKVIIIKGADFSGVALDNIGLTTHVTLVSVKPSTNVTLKNNVVAQGTSGTFSLYMYDVSAYGGRTLRYRNVLRNTPPPSTGGNVGAVFADSADNYIKESFKSIIYNSEVDSNRFEDIMIPNNAKYFFCVWNSSLFGAEKPDVTLVV